jgi:hypothetical protein
MSDAIRTGPGPGEFATLAGLCYSISVLDCEACSVSKRDGVALSS